MHQSELAEADPNSVETDLQSAVSKPVLGSTGLQCAVSNRRSPQAKFPELGTVSGVLPCVGHMGASPKDYPLVLSSTWILVYMDGPRTDGKMEKAKIPGKLDRIHRFGVT